jgi:APA family basic amino acid/polyamine antiporter
MIVAWGYWISLWVSIAAIATAFSGYSAIFIPMISDYPLMSPLIAISAVWVFTYINLQGVENVSIVQMITVILKLIPLFVIGSVGFFIGDISSIPAENPNNESFLIMISGITILVMFSFIGIESATVPSENVIDPKKTIPRALVWGTLTAAAIYILATAGVMAMIPIDALQNSTSPFADAASLIFGNIGATFVGIGALIAIAGALNSNILLTGTVLMAGAHEKLFPEFLKNVNADGTPVTALIFSSMLTTAMIMINSSKGLLKAFEIMILIATFAILLAYLGATLASIKIQLTDKTAGKNINPMTMLNSIIAVLFSTFAIVGAWVIY